MLDPLIFGKAMTPESQWAWLTWADPAIAAQVKAHLEYWRGRESIAQVWRGVWEGGRG